MSGAARINGRWSGNRTNPRVFFEDSQSGGLPFHAGTVVCAEVDIAGYDTALAVSGGEIDWRAG